MSRTAVACLAVVLVACGEGWLPTEPERQNAAPRFAISDGVHQQGNPHFFFLPPMVPDPSASFSAPFDGSLQPTVEICVWDGSACAPIALYNTLSGPGSETVRVSTADQHYVVNWHTEQFALDATKTYRIRVLVNGVKLGYADADIVSSGRELNVQTGEFVRLLNGRTLPIKFRIEKGALEHGGTVSGGDVHTCAVRTDGAAYCWGFNGFGQLGTGLVSFRETRPVPVTGGLVFRSVSAGHLHTCGVTTTGAAYCWGYNEFGQLGTGATYPNSVSASPQPVAGGHMFRSITAGGWFTCGVTTGGHTLCWGYDGYGQLGTGSVTNLQPTPVVVTGGHVFESVSAGESNACGVTAAGQAYCWGAGRTGQLGDGTFTDAQPTPVQVAGGHTFRSLDLGQWLTCGVRTDGAAYCWGFSNWGGALGDGTTAPSNSTTPVPVSGGHSFQSVTAGVGHSCGVRSDGAALCWGYNFFGQLGDGTFTRTLPYNVPTPQLVTGGHTFAALGAGGYHTCGVTTGGDALCWGNTDYGQVGNGTIGSWSTPVFALDLTPTVP